MKNFRPTTMRTNVRTLLVGIVVFSGLLGLLSATTFAMTPQQCQANGVPYDPATQTCQDPGGGSGSGSGSGSGDGGAGSTDSQAPNPNVNSPTPFKPSGCAEEDPAVHDPNCVNSGGTCATVDAQHCDLINLYINPAVRFISAFIGVGVAIAIIYGGIQISSSGGDPSKAAAGKGHIRNAIFTLVVYFFLYALLKFLIPGGV